MTKTQLKNTSDNTKSGETDAYAKSIRGGGKLKLSVVSKDSDKKRRKREKKEKKRLKKEAEQRSHVFESAETIKTRRRFENQSGRRLEPSQLSTHLTRNQLNKITTLENRQLTDLVREGADSYKAKQRRFNKYCQDVTETNEMPCLVMTKIK